MKILITTDWYLSAINGVVISVKNLEKGLKMLGHDVRILTLSETRHSYKKENVYYAGSISANKIYPYARVKLCNSHSILNELTQWKPDIIHSQCEFSTFILARKIQRRTGVALIHTYHTIYEDYTHYFSPNKAMGIGATVLFTRNIAKKTDCMIAPTTKVAQLLESYKIKAPIEVMSTGLDLDKVTSDITAEQKAELKKKLNINQKNKVILYLGRIAKEKNLEEIIQFLSHQKLIDTTFLIVGGGPYFSEVINLIEKNNLADKTVITGMVSPSEVKNYYAISDVFVSSSQSETQGLTYIEALANSVPLLCRNDKCLNDVLINKYNGFDFSNENEFTIHLNQILSADYKYMKSNALNTAKNKFSLLTFANQAESIYNKYIDTEEREYTFSIPLNQNAVTQQ